MQILLNKRIEKYRFDLENNFFFLSSHLFSFLQQVLVCFLFIPFLSNSAPFEKSNVIERKLTVSSSSKGLGQKMGKALQKSKIPARQLGIIVANSDSTLYQMNADKNFIPASLVKIFTASALLDSLSPSLQFTTRFLAKNKINNSILKGNLYLKGGGDSGFVSESLWNLVNNLRRTGLKTIEGDLIVDDQRFDESRRGERLPYSSHFSYDAPVGALSFNWNTANIYLRPGKKVGHPLFIHIDPSSLYFSSIKNLTETGRKSQKKNISIQREQHRNTSKESLKITGHLPIHGKELLIYRNILHPAIWTGWNTIDFLKQRGINITGQVKRGNTASDAFVLAEWQSRPLTEHIKLMMKYSNNFMVEMLVKNMVVELTGKKGNLTEGLKIIKKHIQKIGIKAEDYHLVQASGLSRKNKIKPQQLQTILKYWMHHPLQAEFESALPLSGEDGTLKKYFKNKNLKGRIHAKTGSINGVTGLSGYLITKKGQKRVFVFLFNGHSSLQKKAEELFRQWALIIFNQD